MWSLVTVRVNRPMWIFVGRGVGERRRRLRRSGEFERDWRFDELFLSPRFFWSWTRSFSSVDWLRRVSLPVDLLSFASFDDFVPDLLWEPERRFGRVRPAPLVDEDEEDELLERELLPDEELLDEWVALDELLSEELFNYERLCYFTSNILKFCFLFCKEFIILYLRLLSLLLDPDCFFFFSRPLDFFLSFSLSDTSDPDLSFALESRLLYI